MTKKPNAFIEAKGAGTRKRGGKLEADSIRISLVPHTSVCGQYLAVISEAMLRLASLLRTDHMLGGDQSSTFIQQLNLVIEELADELSLVQG
jgi:hypothetical protein